MQKVSFSNAIFITLNLPFHPSIIISYYYFKHFVVDTEETLFLLATCYYRSGQVRQAYALLSKKALNSAQCRFLLAKCCYDLEK